MATENGEASTSNGQRSEEEKQSSERAKSEGDVEKIPFYKLFSFADSTDVLLMIFGTLGAIGNGLALPLMTILFGEMIDSFGSNQTSSNVVDVVSGVTLFTFHLIMISYLCTSTHSLGCFLFFSVWCRWL